MRRPRVSGPRAELTERELHVACEIELDDAVGEAVDSIVKFDLSGHVEFSFGQFGTRPGYTWAPHQITADSDGNLYLSEVFGGRTQKYRPKPNADPTKLVWGRPLMPMGAARTN